MMRAVWLLPVVMMASAAAQIGMTPNAAGTTMSPGRTARSMDDEDPMETSSMRARRELARKQQFRQRLTDAAARLQALTRQFETQVNGHGTLTPEDTRALDEIAKAAHDVRSRMLGW